MGSERLLALQEVDTAIDRLTARKRILESGKELVGARAEADAAENALGELRLKLDELDRDQRRFEHEVDSMSQKEAAEQKRMYDGSIVNAKELEAIQHEIAGIRKRRTEREDELLALMELRENVEARAKEADVASTATRANVHQVSEAASEELTTLAADLERRVTERDAIAAEIDGEVLELYEDLRRLKKGVGVAALVDGVCQGCHEQLSAVELDRLKRTEDIRRCEHCRRILVL